VGMLEKHPETAYGPVPKHPPKGAKMEKGMLNE